MSEAIIVALITGVFALAGTYFSNRKTASLIEYRILKLEEKVDLHNNFASRIPVLEEKIEVANHRISDLEEKVMK